MTILAGKLKYRITIEKGTESKDSFGTPTSSWSTLSTIKADIFQQRGTKVFANDPESLYHTFNNVFRFRKLIGFGYDCRILYNGDYYTILSIIPEGCNTGYEVVARRNVNDGY